MSGTLHLVATPIGNLEDLSPRARRVLGEVALVACEDTRRTGKLFELAGIDRPRFTRFDAHEEASRTHQVLDVLGRGEDVALVSDAGTPAISDPGAHLVAVAAAAGHTVTAVPGPAAPIVALVCSGLSTDRFVFEGFLPRKGSDRSRRLRAIASSEATSVIFESPRRASATLADLAAVCGDDRRCVVARELTKLHEEFIRGTLAELTSSVDDTLRGEVVIVIAGAAPREAADEKAIVEALEARRSLGLDRRSAVAVVVADTGARKRVVYDLALGLDWPPASS